MDVVDLFCGAGGFSEGFRQAGFKILCGVDNWKPAVDTFSENQPDSMVTLDDVEKISLLPELEFNKIIPDSDVIIGSPPCVAFSNSNKSGKGNKDSGIKLIKAFVRIVLRKKSKKNSKLKYWLLENVPKSESFIQEVYKSSDLGLPGDEEIIVKSQNSDSYEAQYFGVPSKRLRYICGHFPKPTYTILDSADFVSLKDILNTLGEPLKYLNQVRIDPNYPLSLKSHEITDHHYIREVAEFQWKVAKRLKQDRGYMGKMSFPENENRLARTIMATNGIMSREAMILKYQKGRYRIPTVREAASLMSFPIDYRFFGTSYPIKYKLVGNAVPPKMAYAFAKAILEEENLNSSGPYILREHRNKLKHVNLNFQTFPVPEEVPKKLTAKFKYHIPYLIVNTYRVELTNYRSNLKSQKFRWDVEIHKSQGKNAKIFTPNHTNLNLNKDYTSLISDFLKSLSCHLVDYDNFQKIYTMTSIEKNGHLGPLDLLEKIKLFINHLRNEFGLSSVIEIDEAPYAVPEEIAIGYFLLKEQIARMGRL